MERRRLSRIALFASDLDGTLVGDSRATTRFAAFWDALPSHERPLLAYNSGRLVDDMMELVRRVGLPRPDVLIGGVGTEIVASDGRHVPPPGTRWNREAVDTIVSAIPGAVLQHARFQSSTKSSWQLREASRTTLARLEASLAARGLEATVVYSSGRDLDILPAHAGKGSALLRLCAARDIDARDVVVAGDTGNDAQMFSLPGIRGIIVANALDELRHAQVGRDATVYHSRLPEADGVVEGLSYFGLAPAVSATA